MQRLARSNGELNTRMNGALAPSAGTLTELQLLDAEMHFLSSHHWQPLVLAVQVVQSEKRKHRSSTVTKIKSVKDATKHRMFFVTLYVKPRKISNFWQIEKSLASIKNKASRGLTVSPGLVGQNDSSVRLSLAMLGSQGKQRPLFQMQRTPGPACIQLSSATKAWQLGGR